MFNAVLYSSTDCFKSVIIKVSLEPIAEGYEVFDKSDYANKLPSNAHIVATYVQLMRKPYYYSFIKPGNWFSELHTV